MPPVYHVFPGVSKQGGDGGDIYPPLSEKGADDSMQSSPLPPEIHKMKITLFHTFGFEHLCIVKQFYTSYLISVKVYM